MTILKILEYPDPRLRIKAEPVARVTPAVRQLAKDLLETMYAAPGAGLAATQVDQHIRLIVLDLSATGKEPQIFINPEILQREGEALGDEGCLSVPGITEETARASRIQVRAKNLDDQVREFWAEGLLAVCIQHEMDHLEGKLFVDYLSELKRQRLKKRATKAHRRDQEPGVPRSGSARPRVPRI